MGIHRQTDTEQDDLISLKFRGGSQRRGQTQTDRQTDRQQGSLMGLLLSFQNKEIRLKIDTEKLC
jgi:hypothetical protein